MATPVCSGIVADDSNNKDYVLVPFKNSDNSNDLMEIGYITKKRSIMSKIGEEYIEELKRSLEGMKSSSGARRG